MSITQITRRWKRDGSTNTMTLDAAALTIVAANVCRSWKTTKARMLVRIRKQLRDGELLQTERAEFFLKVSG